MRVIRHKSRFRHGAIALLMVALLGIAPGAILGQETKIEPSLFRKSGIRFEICLGRIVLGKGYHTGSRTWTLSKEKEKVKETLVTQAASTPSLEYQWETEAERVQLSWNSAGKLRLARTVGDKTTVYNQEKSGPASLVLESADGTSKVYQANHLWLLWLNEPDVCKESLAPALTTLRADWNPDACLQQAIAEMDGYSEETLAGRREEWSKWVMDLADASFAHRRRADRALRNNGISAWSWLARTNRSQLDPEQNERVSGILNDLKATGDDTPQRLAAWLAEDQDAWLALMRGERLESRQRAKAQLERLLGRTVEFDPAGDPNARSRQIDAIRSLIEKN